MVNHSFGFKTMKLLWNQLPDELNIKTLHSIAQRRSQKFGFGGYKSFFGGEGIKLLNSCSGAIFTP